MSRIAGIFDPPVRRVAQPTSLYRMAEALLNVDDLGRWIRDQKDAGLSYDHISKEMHRLTKGGVGVSLYTVRRWAENAESVA